MNSNDTSHAAADEGAGGMSPAAAGGFGALARTIRGRTTDLLAVAIVLVGGLSLGTKLVRWWGTEEAAVAPPSAAEAGMVWGAGETPVLLEFGERPFRFERHEMSGGRKAVFDRLIDKCAAVADETATMSSDLHSAEVRLLEQLGRLKPVRERAGVWQVFHVELPVTLIVAARTFRGPAAADGSVRRVVCWGMAQPGGEGTWVTYLMRPGGQGGEGSGGGDFALPAGSRKILSLREESGGTLMAFDGEGLPREWTAHFSNRLGERGWKPAQPWSESASGWSAAFVPMEGVGGRIEVSISPVGERGLSGMVSVSPSAID